MRIVMVAPQVGDAFGQERAIAESCRLLHQDGHEIALIYDRAVGELPPHSAALEVKGLSSFHTLSSPFKVQRSNRQILDFLKTFSADVVHLHDLFDFRTTRAIGRRYPTVFTAHTVAASCPSSARLVEGATVCPQKSSMKCVRHSAQYGCLGFLKSDLHRAHAVQSFLMRRNALRQYANSVFAISPYVQRTLIADGWPADKVRLVPNAVEPVFAERFADAPGLLILFAARLEPLKGARVLLDAVSQIPQLPWNVWICGDGSERTALEDHSRRLGLEARVKFWGKMPASWMSRAMASASVLVAPNQGPEAFGLSVAEASLMGVPVVASNIPAVNETLGELGGFLFESKNSSQLAERLIEVFSNPTYAHTRAEISRQRIEALCDAGNHLLSTLMAYESAIAEKKKAPVSQMLPAREGI